jgi:hypothetical protein
MQAPGKRLDGYESAQSEYKVVGLPRENFPSIPEPPVSITTIPGAVLRGMIQRTMFAITQEESRYSLNGAKLILAPHEMKMVATDGHRLTYCQRPVDDLAPGPEIKVIVANLGYTDSSTCTVTLRLRTKRTRRQVQDIIWERFMEADVREGDPRQEIVLGAYYDYFPVRPQKAVNADGTYFVRRARGRARAEVRLRLPRGPDLPRGGPELNPHNRTAEATKEKVVGILQEFWAGGKK